MTLRFPAVADVPLRSPPLVEVICQIRFPPLLRLAESRPIEFQERIRHRFPEFEEQRGIILRVESGESDRSFEAQRGARVYVFHTPEHDTSVTLSADFYALKTTNYTVWPEFSRDLALVHDALVRVFDPAYATRIGLRYVNMITTENTGCRDISEVRALLRSELTCLFETDMWDSADELGTQVVLRDENAKFAIRVGLVKQEQEQGFVLDFDYFVEGRTSLDGVVERCAGYHDAIYRAFRWALRVEEIDAFEPV